MQDQQARNTEDEPWARGKCAGRAKFTIDVTFMTCDIESLPADRWAGGAYMFVSKPFFFSFFFSCRFHQLVFCACLYLLSLPHLFSLKIILYYIRVPFKHRIYNSISRIQLNFFTLNKVSFDIPAYTLSKEKTKKYQLTLTQVEYVPIVIQ